MVAMPPTSLLAALPAGWAWYDYAIAAYLGLTAVSLALAPAEVVKSAPWSKWAIDYDFKTPVTAKVGMLTKYATPFALACYWAATSGLGVMPVLMLVHFGKRILETLFLHDFSGSPTEEFSMCAFISLFYSMVTWLFLRADLTASPLLAGGGLAVFALGQAGNLYHHVLLANLRKHQKGYVVPKGGLFEQVACPHYFFEIVSWTGAAIAAQTVHTWLVACWVAGMLGGRAVVTTAWYKDKFGTDYPASRKHLVPLVF